MGPGGSYNTYNAFAAYRISRLLPVVTYIDTLPLTCSNCRFINRSTNNFCTNCGYPVYPGPEKMAIYNHRLLQRKNLQKKAFAKIANARNALYLLAACCMLGVFYLFSDWKETVIRGTVMVMLGLIYAGLARWSLLKPFTSLLISLIIMLTFAAIYVWAEISSLFATSGGIYMFIIQAVLIYFLLQGVKGAFHADILEEEFKM
jgi:hypothetical protein